MKTIIYAGIFSLLATLTISCNTNSGQPTPPTPPTSPIDDDYSDIAIFEVKAKDSIPTSNEDAAWQTCYEKKNLLSPNFITSYIVEYGEFKAGINYSTPWWDIETHDHRLEGENSPMEDYEWLERNFNITFFVLEFFSIKKEQKTVACNNENTEHNRRTFLKIAKQNNDVNYNGYYWRDYDFKYSYIPTQCIDVECVQDYDAAHPAGTLLNDIVAINYASAEPFIRSGYKNMRAMDFCKFAYKGTLPEPLNTFNTKNVNMVTDLSFTLSLTSAPDVDGVYNFKLTYKDISGQVRSATTIPIRIRGKSE